jgi:hypothetical protein
LGLLLRGWQTQGRLDTVLALLFLHLLLLGNAQNAWLR